MMTDRPYSGHDRRHRLITPIWGTAPSENWDGAGWHANTFANNAKIATAGEGPNGSTRSPSERPAPALSDGVSGRARPDRVPADRGDEARDRIEE